MNLATLLNTAWQLRSRAELRRFRRATACVEQTQLNLLLDMIARNRECQYGREHGFASIDSVADFRQQVPIVDYDQLEAYIGQIAAGEQQILTSEKVHLLEPTSGSSAGRRLIPYTTSLRVQYQRAIAAWIADLFAARPAVRRGRAYWSVTPSFHEEQLTAGGLRIGFADDTEYLGGLELLMSRYLMAVPPRFIHTPTGTGFRYVTLLHLLAAADLALLSAWSPTFVTTLFEPLERWADLLYEDLPGVTSASRVAQVKSILSGADTLPDKLAQLWPRLALVSCWADASASHYLPEVQRLFPRVEIQAKGLMSTEACVSFPLVDQPGSVLALRSHFFEFASDLHEETMLAHELTLGERYRVIVTTGGGLYRYDTGDLVEVVGFENECPRLRFLGRAHTCDMVGEKLSEPFVQHAIERLLDRCQLQPSFVTLVPSRERPGYRLLMQVPEQFDEALLGAIQSTLHELLSENPYYRHAVEIGQLQPAVVESVQRERCDLWATYERACVERGMRVGDIKPVSLDQLTQW